MKTEFLPVAFRVYPEGDVIAIFPTLPGTYSPHSCACYQHIGQHGHVAIHLTIPMTKPATPEQYKDLLAELVSIGYDNLKIVTKPGEYQYQIARRKALDR